MLSINVTFFKNKVKINWLSQSPVYLCSCRNNSWSLFNLAECAALTCAKSAQWWSSTNFMYNSLDSFKSKSKSRKSLVALKSSSMTSMYSLVHSVLVSLLKNNGLYKNISKDLLTWILLLWMMNQRKLSRDFPWEHHQDRVSRSN